MKSPRVERGLPVWHAREGEGYWNPRRGSVAVPEGWVFVAAGDAFVTREVKKGPHWVLFKRRKGYTATLGVFCPDANLASAEKRREETAVSRERQRTAGGESRSRAESRYRVEMEGAKLDFLAFRPEHAMLAREIARGATAQATVVGSGRVGRSRKLSLPERAELAARAYLRHRCTDYETQLEKASTGSDFALERDPEDPLYREVKSEAKKNVERFLIHHR